MSLTKDQASDCIRHLYVMGFLRSHLGVTRRHDVSVALEFLVWLKANHSTLVEFFDSHDEILDLIRDYISGSQN